MLYVLVEQDYDEVTNHGVLDGPEDLDITALKHEFNTLFLVPAPQYPVYTGRTVPLKYGPCSSGSIPEGTPFPDQSDPSYPVWLAAHQEVSKQYQILATSKRNEIFRLYPGDTYYKSFITWLKATKGFVDVIHKKFDL